MLVEEYLDIPSPSLVSYVGRAPHLALLPPLHLAGEHGAGETLSHLLVIDGDITSLSSVP